MSITPYTPTDFSTPIANPAVGGTGTPVPYLSISQYAFAPTGIDTSQLVVGGPQEDQDQALADVLTRASAWADRICFGYDPSAKGASLCATLTVETALVPVLQGELRLICDYKPIIQVNGVDVGWDMQALTSIGNNTAKSIRIGRRTIYVPMRGFAMRANTTGNPNVGGTSGKYVAVWSYVNGYPHTFIVDDVVAGTNTLTVAPTDGGTGVLGIIPGATQLSIVDGSKTERFTVESVTGTTITSATNFLYDHTPPTEPDFIPVTTMPGEVGEAVILIANTLIKTQGDNSLVLDEMREPKRNREQAGDMFTDLDLAKRMLKPYMVRIKSKV